MKSFPFFVLEAPGLSDDTIDTMRVAGSFVVQQSKKLTAREERELLDRWCQDNRDMDEGRKYYLVSALRYKFA